ncbi:MAG TPA: translocation/assembly module TamB domain-containing protein [Gemmatimonadota bacterium]|nr:translocation/assembly module TamB domain-containing protein [Gemmatimonadota bacterium]
MAGVVAGNLEGFDLRGTAELDEVVVAGNRIGAGRAEYAWLDALTPRASVEADAVLDSLRAGGLAFDSLSARVRHHQAEGNGTADLAVYQDGGHEYRLGSRYDLRPDQGEVRLDSLSLRMDDTHWALAEPSRVGWGGQGIEVDRIELRERSGGRILVDGRLPTEGTGDFELAIEQLQIGDLVALLPDTVEATGLLSVHATVEGTMTNPRLEGDLRLVDFTYGGGRIPMLEATFDYADTELTSRAAVRNLSRELLIAEGTLPVDLSLTDDPEERLLDRPMRLDLRLDDLQLDSLPQFTEAVGALRGRVDGTVEVRGTPRAPEVDGAIHLDGGAADLTQPGIELREVTAALAIHEDTLVLDSLSARSDGGPIRAAGTLDITTPTRPGFDLILQASGAEVLDNEQGRLVVDSDLAIKGPFDRVRVTGDINVREGVIYIPESEKPVIDFDDPALTAVIDTTRVDPVLLPRPNPLLDNLEVDVDVQIARDTWFRNSDANIELYTPVDGPLSLHLDQRERAFTLEGSIQTDRGEYSYSGRRFEIDNGSIIFLGNPEFNPLLQILAHHEVPQPRGEALTILITIGGTLVQPTIELGSNAQPPLSETDLISYLAFGRSSSSLLVQGGSTVSGGEPGSDDLGALATQKLSGVALGALMEEALKDLEAGGLNELGLDVFRISPADLPDELGLEEGGNVFRSTELEAGKYLTPRIFVAGQGRATSSWPGIRLEYHSHGGFVWTTTWEPRYLPSDPTFDPDTEAVRTRVFGSFLQWEWRY